MTDNKSNDSQVSSLVPGEADQVPDKTKISKKLFGRRFTIILGLVAVAAFLFYWLGLRSIALKQSPEMSGLARPSVDSSGRMDYFKSLEGLYAQGMKTDDNVARRLVAQFGPGNFVKLFDLHPGYKEYFFEQLGLEAKASPSSALPDLDGDMRAFLDKKYPGDDNLHRRNACWALFKDTSAGTLDGAELAAWNNECQAFCQNWFEQKAPVLDKVVENLQGKILCFPFIRPGDKDILPELLAERHRRQNHFVQTLADLFVRRANLECQRGNFTRALADIAIVRRMAKLVLASEPRFIQTDTVALNLDKTALLFDFSVNPNFRPDKEFWTKYKEVVTTYPCEDFGEGSTDNELVFGAFPLLENLMHNRKLGQQFEIPISSWLGYDWNAVAKSLLAYKNNEEAVIKLEYEAINLPEKTKVKRRLRTFNLQLRSELLAWDICHAMVPRFDAFYETGRLNRCLVNVRRIMLAMEQYRYEHKTYPPAFTVDASGKPLQSWRVLLLPYLGEKEKALYAKIKLQEPWNSDHNKQFHRAEVPVFHCPSSTKHLKKNDHSIEGKTTYVVVVGKDALFDNSGKGKPCPDAFRPETPINPFPNILVAERHRLMCWMNPGHEIEEKNLFKGVNCTWSHLRMAGFPDYHPGPVKHAPACLDSSHRGVVLTGQPRGRLILLPQTLGGAI